MNDLWLKHVRQEGLVISQVALEDVPIRQTADDTEIFTDARGDIRQIMTDILEWPENRILKGADLPSEATCFLEEIDVRLEADAALKGKEGELPKLLIRILDADTAPDARDTVPGWDGVTQQQAFDRLLRKTGVEAGLLATPDVLRLTYSPIGETPGYLEWPIEGLTTTAGREMLAGLKLVLGRNAIWGDETSSLKSILRVSREKQNTVSTQLADQVLGALYTLLRGFTDPADADLKAQMQQIADHKAHHFYEGLLTVLLRLVFVLFSEDRDLMPSAESDAAKTLYDQGYSIRGLFGQLEEDAARYPDTMQDRYGAWGRLAALFQLVHNGMGPDFMHERRGKLFNPKTFPFLMGQFADTDEPGILPVSDKCIHSVLKSLLILNGERLSYKTLDVEQIGSVYETVMGFTVERTVGHSIALKTTKAKVPAYINLDKLLETKASDRAKKCKEWIDYKVTPAQNKDLKTAKTRTEIVAALDRGVDDRGSPGNKPCLPGTIILQPTDERRSTGSHYTPRSLTAPIVKEALEPILVRLGDDAKPDEILELKICDPAMGSGAFLVEACRALGERLQLAWTRHPGLMPEPAKRDPEIYARREVARRCIYGVDKNHMATDLAKLSLWLITLSRHEDFSFLDHALKTGDSLVGLSLKEITNMTWSLSDQAQPALFATAFRKKVGESRAKRGNIRRADYLATFEQQLDRLVDADHLLDDVRLGGDAIVAAFFEGKKAKDRKANLAALQDTLDRTSGEGWEAARKSVAKLKSDDHPITPFHWEIEFPEVFTKDEANDNPGFDSFVGNPPFAGRNTIINGSRDGYLHWLKVLAPDASGNSDLAAYFYRRAYALLREGGTMGLIATNTIAQGYTREAGLRYLLEDAGGHIYRAQRRHKWQGDAAVVTCTVHMMKGDLDDIEILLDDKPVSRISAFIREGTFDATPVTLEESQNIVYQGVCVTGIGFTFDNENAAKGKTFAIDQMNALLVKDPKNQERIKPYLGGSELNTDPNHQHHRYVIDFEDFPLRRVGGLVSWYEATESEKDDMLKVGAVSHDYPYPVAEDWPDLLQVVRELVKPERDKAKRDKVRDKWWIYEESRPGLMSKQLEAKTVYALSRVSAHLSIAEVKPDRIYSDSCAIITDTKYIPVFSTVHEVWARLFSSSLEDRLRYAASDCFRNFPMPENLEQNNYLNSVVRGYLDHRTQTMVDTNLGLTKTYNRFHDQFCHDADVVELRRLHAEMDDAVLRAYGWDDLADLAKDIGPDGAAPRFLHGTDEPEFAYQKRYHWPAWFRDKVLARLLELNRERAEAQKQPNAVMKSTKGKMTSDKLQLDTKGSLL